MKTAGRNLLVLVGITAFALTVLMAFGCGDDTEQAADGNGNDSGTSDLDPGGPSAVVEKYYTALMSGDCATAYNQYYVDPSDPAAQATVDSYIDDCENEVAIAGPVEGSFQITSEEPAGDTATVKVIIYDSKTGVSQAVSWSVRKVDGEWKLTDA